jgi:predicted permease
MDLGSHETPAWPEGYDAAGEARLPSHFNVVSDGYFETIRVPLVRGRTFVPSDAGGSELVAVVSRTFAERAWPGQDAIGRRLRIDGPDAELRTVVGVVADVKNQMLTDDAEPMLYLPHAQVYRPALLLLVRSDAPGAVVADRMRGAIRALDPNLSLTPVASVEEYTGIGLLPQRLAAWVTTVLGLVALLLAGMGVYGVIAFTVAQQTREIGVRMALGALRRDVLALVLRRGLRLALPGLVLGIAAGLAASRVARGFILGVAPADPPTFVLAPLVLLGVVVAATIVPARRAASVDPSRVLRAE